MMSMASTFFIVLTPFRSILIALLRSLTGQYTLLRALDWQPAQEMRTHANVVTPQSTDGVRVYWRAERNGLEEVNVMNIRRQRTDFGRPELLLASFISAVLFAVVGLPPGHSASAAAVAFASTAAAPKVYVTLHDDSAVAVLDTTTNRVLRTIPVPLGPRGLAMTPDGSKVYVGSDEVSTVSVIDAASDRIVAQIDVGATSSGLTVSPDGRQVLVSVWGADELVTISAAADRITGRVPVPKPDRSAISPDGRVAYVGSTSLDAPGLAIIDLKRLTHIGRVPLSHVPRALAFSPNGGRLYFTADGVDTVQVLDPRRNKVVAEVPAGASPRGLMSVAARYGLVASESPDELEIFDLARNVVSGTVPVGKRPYGIAIGPDEQTVYLANGGSNELSVIDLADRKVTRTISLGDAGYSPREIVVQPRFTAPVSHSQTFLASRPVADEKVSHLFDVGEPRPKDIGALPLIGEFQSTWVCAGLRQRIS
jgi:YVTN family beta-propeller protein